MAVYFVNFEGQAEYGDMEIPTFQNEIEPELDPQVEVTPDLSQTFASDLEAAPETFDSSNDSNINSFAHTAQEIADYGNDEDIVAGISYDVLIKGLDTKEVMQEFKDAIEDSKFAWITQDILNQIKNGESHLTGLNPIQAYVLASRIQFLDLEIEWKQNVSF
jgi:hypothetical protein